MSLEFSNALTLVYFINFFLASSYSCLFIFRKFKEEYFFSAVILCGVLALSLYIFFAFFEKYSHDFKIYLLPVFVILNLMAGLYFLFREKFFGR
jgi:tryptophan-rich sensory protein